MISETEREILDRIDARKIVAAETNWTGVLITAVVLAVVGLLAIGWYQSMTPSLYTEYSAVRLTNGETYYGKLSGLGNKFPMMKDVFTIGGKLDVTKGVEESIMVPRQNEFHSPARTILNADHIVFVESVAAASQVGQLIKRMPRGK